MNKAEFYHAAKSFLENLFTDLEKNNIKIQSHWDVDHLCYRTDNLESYHYLKNQFNDFGKLLIASDVNGREIATFELHTPVEFKDWKIYVVELPAPKVGKITPTGFEHIEVVTDLPFEELKTTYGHLTLDTRGLNKNFNKELEICLGDNNIKFHHLSLKSVINVERNKKVFNAIESSQILKLFAENSPLIAGTFPLALDVENSDVDVLLRADDLEQVKNKLKTEYGNCPGFSQTLSVVDELNTLICKFVFADIPFEVFVQNREPVRQKAYLHFLIEERLLKLGGESLFKKIKTERLLGTKTEPAFAKVLKIKEDPYSSLLELQTQSHHDIAKIIEGL